MNTAAKSKNQRGAGLVEMALLIALISVMAIASAKAVGTSVSDKLIYTKTSLDPGYGVDPVNDDGHEYDP